MTPSPDLKQVSDLESYFRNNTGRRISKWTQYFDVYERHFSRFRGKPVVMLEIGVGQGGSLQMWKHYFGAGVKIYGIDVDPLCAQLAEDNIEILIGSQSDRAFLRDVKHQIGQVDILLDDGGHTMRQQIITFEELFSLVAHDGVYVVEDLHTSYWPSYGGGLKRWGTFIEYSKNFIDYIHGHHSRQWRFRVNAWTKSIASLHFYDSILVIEKRAMSPPSSEWTGKPVIARGGRETRRWARVNTVVRRDLARYVNVALGWLRLPGIS